MEQQLGRRLKTKGTKISLFLLIFHLCKKEKPHLVCHGLWTFSHNCRENTAAGMLQQQNILFGPESHNKNGLYGTGTTLLPVIACAKEPRGGEEDSENHPP